MPQKLGLGHTLALPLQRLWSKPIIPKPHSGLFQPFKHIPDKNKESFALFAYFRPIWMVPFGELPERSLQPRVIDCGGYTEHFVEVRGHILDLVEESIKEVAQDHERECYAVVPPVLCCVWWGRGDAERPVDRGSLVYEVENMLCCKVWDERPASQGEY